MNNIIEKQKSKEAINAGGAFKRAYALAKNWKAFIWFLTFVLAILQLIATAYPSYLCFDVTPVVVCILIISMLSSILGQELVVDYYINLGANAQRLYDHIVLGVLNPPESKQLSLGKIHTLSRKWFAARKRNERKRELEEWRPEVIAEIPHHAGLVAALISTIRWEFELRKQYALMLIILLAAIIMISIIIGWNQNYTVDQFVIKIFVPITPFFSVVMYETVINMKAVKLAESSFDECVHCWQDALNDSLSPEDIMTKVTSIMITWQHYRHTVSPIFDWAYKVVRQKLNSEMIMDAKGYVTQYQQSHL